MQKLPILYAGASTKGFVVDRRHRNMIICTISPSNWSSVKLFRKGILLSRRGSVVDSLLFADHVGVYVGFGKETQMNGCTGSRATELSPNTNQFNLNVSVMCSKRLGKGRVVMQVLQVRKYVAYPQLEGMLEGRGWLKTSVVGRPWRWGIVFEKTVKESSKSRMILLVGKGTRVALRHKGALTCATVWAHTN